jgi:hypothetical protein
LSVILKFVFRLPLHGARLHDNQVRRLAAAGSVAFDRLHEGPALRTGVPDRRNPAARAVEPIQGA